MKSRKKNEKGQKKNPFFYIKPPSTFLVLPSLLANMRHLLLCLCYFPPLELRPPSVFRESAWSRDQKKLFFTFLFYIFFSSFLPGLKPFCWAHTHTRCLQSRAAPVCFPPLLAALSTHWGKKKFFSVDSQHLKTFAAQFFHAHWILFSTSEIWMNVARSTDNNNNNSTNRWVTFLYIYYSKRKCKIVWLFSKVSRDSADNC